MTSRPRAEAAPSPRPMKILLITYEYPPVGGGTGKAAMNTARCLRLAGHETVVLTSRFKDQLVREIVDGTPVLRIPVLRRHLNYANAVEVLSFGISGMMRARGLLRNFRPDLTLAYHVIPSALVSRAMLGLEGIPYIALLLGQDVPGHPETRSWMHTLAWPVTRHLWASAYRCVANSEGLAELARRSAPAFPFEVVRTGIDLERFRPARSDQKSNGVFRVCYIGRLTRQKRIRELVESWPAVVQQARRKVELAIAGFGPEREPLEAFVRELQITDSVRFLGRIEESEVVGLLQSSDLLVNPSSAEGLPNVVLEAMACGLPVVLSNIPPHRELIGDGEAGLLCDGAKPSEVGDRILRLMTDKDLSRRLGAEGRKIVEERFSWEDATRRLERLFPVS